MKLIVKEIFYSLQGEGGRAGEASVFIRLCKCNLNCTFCDTDFEEGKEMALQDIKEEIEKYPAKWIIWTGGEPTLQLKEAHTAYFHNLGYKQAIETNGTREVPKGIDYISCSPKINYKEIKRKLPVANEIRIPVQAGDEIPGISILPQAEKYYLSPVFEGDSPNFENINYVVSYIEQHPEWILSLQLHKLINIE